MFIEGVDRVFNIDKIGANKNIFMPNAELSFPDRLNRGRTMQAAIAGFTPVFAPGDANLSAGAFNSYLNGVEEANSAVSDSEPTATNAVTDRRTAAVAVQDTALRVKDHVASNVAWKKFAPTIGAASKLVRGTHLPKKPKPASDAGATPKKARMGAASQQGFADIAKNFGKLIAAVQKVTGYSAGATSGLTVAALTAQATAFGDLNQAVTNADADLAEKQRVRLDYYNGENGLRAKMKSIKLAVRSQYGSRSAQFAAVKGIKL